MTWGLPNKMQSRQLLSAYVGTVKGPVSMKNAQTRRHPEVRDPCRKCMRPEIDWIGFEDPEDQWDSLEVLGSLEVRIGGMSQAKNTPVEKS